VMGSVLWMEGSGLGLARNIVQRYAQRLADGRLDVVVMRDHAQRPVMLESAFERELRSG